MAADTTRTLTGTLAGTLMDARGVVRDFWDLTKPRITALVLVTEYTGMFLAAGGPPDLKLTFFTLLGTALAAGSSSVLNNWVDREVDRLMERTRNRPLAARRITANVALSFGLLLGMSSFVLLWSTVNLLTAAIGVAIIAFYVGIYTIWLKRATPLCTSIGGIAGAAPPLMGWAAVTGTIGLPVWGLFALLYLWQPPHFWALALIRADEYRLAGLPMLPVACGTRVTKRQMLLYTAALLPVSIALYPLGLAGPWYGSVAAVMSSLYLYKTIQFVRREVTRESARSLFFFSLWYLTIVFTVLFLDSGAGSL